MVSARQKIYCRLLYPVRTSLCSPPSIQQQTKNEPRGPFVLHLFLELLTRKSFGLSLTTMTTCTPSSALLLFGINVIISFLCSSCSFTGCVAFTPFQVNFVSRHSKKTEFQLKNNKQNFLDSLDDKNALNQATKERSILMQTMIDKKISVPFIAFEPSTQSCMSLENPGLLETFSHVAEGCWKVIYAPHMTTIAGLFGGKFDVNYILYPTGKMESHAEYNFPIVGRGFLSVSGTYGSVDKNTSRVDFDQAWIKPLPPSASKNNEPYPTFEQVPDSLIKHVINSMGKTLFIEQFSVFPISFLDDNLIVFDFPLLGTRICALKQ